MSRPATFALLATVLPLAVHGATIGYTRAMKMQKLTLDAVLKR